VIYTGALSTPVAGLTPYPTVDPIADPTPVEHPYFPKNVDKDADKVNPTRIQTVFGAFTGFTAESLPCGDEPTPTPSVTPEPTTAPGGSGSGGGCNVGLAPLALVLLAPLALFLKK